MLNKINFSSNTVNTERQRTTKLSSIISCFQDDARGAAAPCDEMVDYIYTL